MRILFLFILTLIVGYSSAQTTIANARTKSIGSTVTITGVVTNGSELGQIRYMQDSTAGIAVYDSKLSGMQQGDSITITGKLDDYNNLLEIKDVSEITTHNSSGKVPAPKVIYVADIGEDYEGQLIQINDIEIEDAGSSFAGGKNYDFTDGSNSGELRINNGSPIVDQPIPTGKIGLVALCSQYSFESNDTRDGYQLLPRDMDDFISDKAVKLTSGLRITNITKNKVGLSWTTDVASSSEIRYGTENNIASLTNHREGSSTPANGGMHHEAEVIEMQAAEILYVQAFSVSEGDTAFSGINAIVSESNSSGEINVYFNSSVDESLAGDNIANDIGQAMEDTLAAYIDRAASSIDFCIYNFNNDRISDALNDAHARGVTIRLITCESTTHASVGDLHNDIPVLERPEIQQGGIMHNKFVVFDAMASDANKPWVWSGSTNLTSGQLLSDANNMIFIQDQALALTYKIEFEEMWGSTGNQPNLSNAKFGEDKTDNTPHELVIGGKRVESYFSPSDNTNQRLIDAISTSDKNLSVQTMLITRTEIANAITDAYDRSVQVHVITDDKNSNSDAVNDILSSELPSNKFIYDDRASGTLHHKLAIIDVDEMDSDPQVITGSHNWSFSANTRNDENTLIIHNADIANQYFQQFAYRFEQNDGDLVVSAEEIEIAQVKLFPNPTQNRIQISAGENLTKVEIFTIQGALVKQVIPSNPRSITINLASENNGLYILKLESENKTTNTYKVIKN